MSCNCSADWRVELLDLATGVRKAYAKPISFTFEEMLNQVGAGSLVLPVRRYRASDVWPHLTSVVFSRMAGPGASPAAPVGVWLGMVEQVGATSEGSLTLGLKSIEHYLSYRVMEKGYQAAGIAQTAIGAAFVNGASASGVPLTGVALASAINRERTFLPEDFKERLEAVKQLTEVIDGPDYILTHQQDGSGAWSTDMTFSDRAGETEPLTINARRGLTSYSLDVSAENHRNNQFGIGSTASDHESSVSTPYPQFDKVDQWTDVTDPNTLADHTLGALRNDEHPRAVPSLTVADLDLAARYDLGDVVALTMNHGALQYVGNARLVSKSWSLSEGSPPTCTFGFVPETDPVASVLNAPPEGPRKCC